jgi:serpin B
MKKVIFIILSILLFHNCEINNEPNLKSLSPQDKELIATTNNFAYNIFKAVSESDKNLNVFISPLSISYALAMTFNGADGETAEQMQALLGFGNLTKNDLNNSFKNIYDIIIGMDKKVELSLANSIWYKQEYTVNTNFKNDISKYYNAEINPVNTCDSNTKNKINKWVENKTKDKIKNLIDNVTCEDVMFLINAIYFKAEWTKAFDKDKTYDGEFVREDGTKDACKMMKGTDINYYCYKDSILSMYELPYGNKQFSMMFLLPEKSKIDEFISDLNVNLIEQVRKNSYEKKGEIHIPKFKIEYEKRLNEILIAMRMPRAFDSSMAEFPNLFQNSKDLFISLVKHKSYIDVYEEGTEAAAATVVGIEYTAFFEDIVKIDRPFVYIIIEKHTNTVLFIGKIIKLG